jgi:hypothetical protein
VSENYDETEGPPPDMADGIVEGDAVEVMGNPEEYIGMDLVRSEPVTLLFVPNQLNALPGLGAVAHWAGTDRTVQATYPIRPQGVGLAARLILT